MFLLRLFGEVAIESEGGRLTGRAVQRHRLALLTLLAAGMSRDKLIAYLWPESDAERGRHLLSNSIYVLRQALGEEAILATSDTLRLNPAVVRADVVEFEHALAESVRDKAVCLYRAPFLDGFFLSDAPEFERWVETERDRLDRLYSEALENLATEAEANGNFPEAAKWWRRLAVHDPLSSRIALRLMHALETSGDSAAALQHARVHENVLRDELGIEPNAEVTAFADRLQAEGGRREQASPLPDAAIGISERVSNESETAVASVRTPETAPLQDARHRDWRWRRGALAAVLLGSLLAAGIWHWELATGTSEKQTERTVREVDPVAHGLYLKARNAWSKRSREDLERAVVYFRQAIERDPTYAEAYAGLADTYVILGYLGYLPAEAMFPKGKAAAVQALELDSTLAEAYAPLGQALIWERRWAEAEAAFRKAIALDPGYATAHQWYASLLAPLGRLDEAVEHLRHASELAPLSLQINNNYAMLLHFAGHSEAALRHYRKIVEVEPDSQWVRQNPWLLSNAARVYAAHGLYDEALRALDQSLKINPRHPRPLWDLASVYVQLGQPEKAPEAFARADTTHVQYPFFRGAVSAVLGQPDSAFHWFERAEEWSPSPLGELRANPLLQPIRSDPRYPELLKRLGLLR